MSDFQESCLAFEGREKGELVAGLDFLEVEENPPPHTPVQIG